MTVYKENKDRPCHEGWIILFAIICPFGLIAYALYKYLKTK